MGIIEDLVRRVSFLERAAMGGHVARPKVYSQHFSQAVAATMMLPGIRGCWPGTNNSAAAAVIDVSGQNQHLGRNGSTKIRYDGITPNIDTDGVGDYFDRASEAALEITGTEGHVSAQHRGLSIGLWYRPDVIPAAAAGIFGKWLSTGNQRSYLLYQINDGTVRFYISGNGTAFTQVISTVTLAAAGDWYYLAGAYDPSTTMDIYVNDTKTSETASVPASIYVSTASLDLARYDGHDTHIDGRFALMWLSCMYLDSTILNTHYEMTRAAFGKY